MTRRVKPRTWWALCGVLAIAGTTGLAQGALAQLGVTEANARQQVLDNIESGGSASVQGARSAYAPVAPAARGQVTTALYAWTRAYVNSPAFKTAYATMRTGRKPELPPMTGTPEQEAQAMVDAKVTEMETTTKAVRASIPEADRAKFDAQMKSQVDALKSPETLKGFRMQVSDRRAKDKAEYDESMAQWTRSLPPDPNVRIAEILREFLDATSDVDFGARTKVERGEAGEFVAFVNDAYNKKSWQWSLAFDLGPEAVAAARGSATAWLKELPAK